MMSQLRTFKAKSIPWAFGVPKFLLKQAGVPNLIQLILAMISPEELSPFRIEMLWFNEFSLWTLIQIDALESSHPISIEVKHPDEINEIFDRISYAKGASILRMMDHFLTRGTFRRGLSNYLKALWV